MPYTVELNRMMGNQFSMGLFHTRSVMEGQLQRMSDGLEQKIEKDFRQTGVKLAFHFNNTRILTATVGSHSPSIVTFLK